MSAAPSETAGVGMAGKVAVVTGATGGIGKEIARGLAGMGATVVIGARSRERGDAAAAEIAADTGNSDLVVMELDVADQDSIRAFAAALGARFASLDVLVNNAGAWFTDRGESPDGLELTLATNVLGPYLLTELLLDALSAARQGRIVNIVSSFAGEYDAADLQFTRRPYDGFKAYTQSKQALSMLTWGLAARLAGSGVTANTAEPGFVRTDLNRNVWGLRVFMIDFFNRLIGISPARGADTPLWVATAPELEGVTGRLFAARKENDSKFREPEPIADLERRCAELTSRR